MCHCPQKFQETKSKSSLLWDLKEGGLSPMSLIYFKSTASRVYRLEKGYCVQMLQFVLFLLLLMIGSINIKQYEYNENRLIIKALLMLCGQIWIVSRYEDNTYPVDFILFHDKCHFSRKMYVSEVIQLI
mmetsp:Transcript_25527/g.33365  ORF Transcript_25527/g.33365 Transcript_25527/m.33365 type:complete len:129 (+) Transcript_25527:826-1212(+)